MKLWKRVLSKFGMNPVNFQAHFPPSVDRELLFRQCASFFQVPLVDIRRQFDAYYHLHVQKGYEDYLGERKTLCLEEAFIVFLLISISKAQAIVEIGTQYGKSTRKIIDMVTVLGLKSSITCFDIQNEVQFFDRSEATVVLNDVTDSVLQDVLIEFDPDLIFLDARPYQLIYNVVQEMMCSNKPRLLVIHDCSPGLYNPRMTIDKQSLAISSKTGVWERHVLAEHFKVQDPSSNELDDITMGKHHLRIFTTQHGLAVIKPISSS